MNHKFKILMVLQTYPAETPFLKQKFEGLQAAGWDVKMLCLQGKAMVSIGKDRVIFNPVQSKCTALTAALFLFIYTIIENPSGFFRFWGSCPGSIWNKAKRFCLDGMMIALNPDLIHFEFGPLAVGRMYLKEVLKCKIVVSFRGYDLNYVKLDDDDYYKEVWDKADAIHTLGEDLWRKAVARGCPPDKFHVLIPPAVDTEFFDGARHPSQGCLAPLKILSVGRLVWKKGYEYALQAIRILKDTGLDVEYEIIGNGPYLEAVAYARHDLGLEDCVKLVGSLEPAKVKEKMRSTDIFLHAAVSEGFCNAVLEAQAMQLPVVTSDADCLSENVLNGVTGFVVPRRDPKALAEKILELANTPELGQRMGQAGRERVVKHFKIKDQIKAFSNLYENITN